LNQRQNSYRLKPKAYKKLFDLYYKPLCLFADKYVNDLEISKDIVQEVFIKVWEKKIDFRDKNAVKSYFYSAVRNKCLDTLKSSRYNSVKPLSERELQKYESEIFFHQEVLIEETFINLKVHINKLPEKCAQIMQLVLQNYSNAEIAKEFKLSINTVKAQKKIAYKRLRNMINYYIF
jgi:RNA polymerase sigma-70 factor (ECF subfamily)